MRAFRNIALVVVAAAAVAGCEDPYGILRRYFPSYFEDAHITVTKRTLVPPPTIINPDLFISEIKCKSRAGYLQVVVIVGNQGLSEAPLFDTLVDVNIANGHQSLTSRTTQNLPAGAVTGWSPPGVPVVPSPGVNFDGSQVGVASIPATPGDQFTVGVTVDVANEVADLNRANNTSGSPGCRAQ